jgi:pyruvate,water dikinase
MAGIVWLKDAGDATVVGGKASSLARLIKAGFNVPEGFVVPASVKEMDEALEYFDKLGASEAAVRSSAVAEDGAKDAWAGQMETFLNVGRADLTDKISLCMDSAGSARAKAYARQKNVSAGKVAVIVQKMVPADVSGVTFSVNPVTNDRSQMVIESVAGLGEKLVSGSATPDTYITSRIGDMIENHLVGKKPNLSEIQIRELAEKISQIEKLFNFPVDVEWAFAGSELFILQSRPITTLG